MSIIGINYEKCTNCGLCVKECSIKIRRDKEKNRFYVPNPTIPCFSCGHCIAICPKDAITLISNKASVNKMECISCEICINSCPIGAITWEIIK